MIVISVHSPRGEIYVFRVHRLKRNQMKLLFIRIFKNYFKERLNLFAVQNLEVALNRSCFALKFSVGNRFAMFS